MGKKQINIKAMNNIMNKPFSGACEQNQQVIFQMLEPYLQNVTSALEVGSGTGQHAIYFASKSEQLSWQTSDLQQYHQGILNWIADSGLQNVLPPMQLDVCESWPDKLYDLIFSANTLHIMSDSQVECFFASCGTCLKFGSRLMIYGPFNYNQQYSSDSNRQFDIWLKQRDPASSIKDFGWLNSLAQKAGFSFERDIEMPANNRMLIWLYNN